MFPEYTLLTGLASKPNNSRANSMRLNRLFNSVKHTFNELRRLLATSLAFVVLAFGQITAVCATEQPHKILVLGDSISAAYGIDQSEGWVTLLQNRLAEQSSNTTVINASISGATTGDGLARLPKLLQTHRPSIVIVELGGNDGLRGYPLKVMQRNLSAIIEQVQADGAAVVLAGIEIPPNYGARYTQQFREVYQTLATEYKVEFLPFILQGVATQPELMQRDGIHPVAQAQAQLLDNIWPLVKPLIAEDEITND